VTSYAWTTSGRYLGSLYSDEETDREQREQRTSVPVVLDDSDVHAIIDDVESRPCNHLEIFDYRRQILGKSTPKYGYRRRDLSSLSTHSVAR